MLSFVDDLAQRIGMVPWNLRQPNLGDELIVMSMCIINDVKSWKSVEAVRGFYSTWTEGESVMGAAMGLQSKVLPVEARTAFLNAQANHKVPVMLFNPKMEYTGQIRPGVIEADLLKGAWWITVEALEKTPVAKGSLFDLARPKTHAPIRYKNVVYPIDNIPDRKIVT